MSNLDLAYRLSNLAFENSHRNMTRDGAGEAHPSNFSTVNHDILASTLNSVSNRGDTIDIEAEERFRNLNAANSGATVERRKSKRETLSNYLTTGDK